MKYKNIITKEFLYQKYIIKELYIMNIAKIVGCSYTAVRNKLIKYDFSVRGHANKGKKHPFYGKHRSEKTKQKIAKALMGRSLLADTKRKISKALKGRKGIRRFGKENPMYGKHRSKELRDKISKAHKGKSLSEAHKRKLSEIRKGKPSPFKGKHHSRESKKKISEAVKGEFNPNYNKHFSEETRKKMSEAKKGYHPSIEALRKRMKSNNISPNKPERKLNKLLQELFHRQYKFVGDGRVVIDGLCPDFININGQKKIIELYGDYWHSLPERKKVDARRIKAYAKFGYKTLVVWEHELKDLDTLREKILIFNGE